MVTRIRQYVRSVLDAFRQGVPEGEAIADRWLDR